MTARYIMVQGTGSSVGKSRIVAGLCRVFKQDGFRVAPFKSQNMALNSFITREGLEMGRAQVAQAEACGLEPSVLMNPVLLKPSSDKNCQVMIMGKVYGNLSAVDYHEFKPKLLDTVKQAIDILAQQNDIIVIEGAGSPAEINLRERDIVNMGMAELVDAPVVLVGDIDKGGVFASLAGTMLLLNENERVRVKGVIINKFRGDLEILKPGLEMLEGIIKRPVLGVVPYTDIYIDEEDSPEAEIYRMRYNKNHPNKVSDRNNATSSMDPDKIIIKVLYLPHISNFTDFVPLAEYPGVTLSYVKKGMAIGEADMVIIPGTKNTLGDLEAIKSQGWHEEIKHLSQKGAVILGICGGYQMLGKSIKDPYHIEGNIESSEGLGLLDVHTRIETEKVTTRISGRVLEGLPGLAGALGSSPVVGYEIHMGKTVSEGDSPGFVAIEKRLDKDVYIIDGCVSSDGRILGTYIHGIFDSPEFTSRFVGYLRKFKGIQGDYVINNETGAGLNQEKAFDFAAFKQAEYDRWADVIRKSLDMGKIYKIIGLD
ncbi:MAG: adenosylcobyric acid synthase [Thermoanaerobacteraceae bacterium]|nr:adenosylcobyric acid synthase [Thermoanaerobacteraceae bacterium]MDN5311083.1 adenosylcobyric acid synthase [Thermoanaerobacteraceae bacterium]